MSTQEKSVLVNAMDRVSMSERERCRWDEFVLRQAQRGELDPCDHVYQRSWSKKKSNRRIRRKAEASFDRMGPFAVMDQNGRIWLVPSIAYPVRRDRAASFETPIILFHDEKGGVSQAHYAWPVDQKRMDYEEAAHYAQYHNVPLDDAQLRFGIYPKSLPEGLRHEMGRRLLTESDINRLRFARLGLKIHGS